MRFLLCIAALVHRRPLTLLRITHNSATLSSIATAATPYATFTPVPYVLNDDAHLASGFQLRTFIESHLPITARRPFSIVVHLPPLPIEHARRLGSQIAAVLLQLKLPAYVITQSSPPTVAPHTAPCIFFDQPVGRPMPYKTVIGCVLLAMICTAYTYFLSQHHPSIESTLTLPPPIVTPLRATIQEPFHPTIIAYFLSNTGSCHMQTLQVTSTTARARYWTDQPSSLNQALALLLTATHKQWRLKPLKYTPGMPPLYYGILESNLTNSKDSA